MTNNSDSIQVIVRVRGLNQREQQEGAGSCITPSYINPKLLKLDSKPSPKNFIFDHVCQPDQTQQDIFKLIGHNLVDSCLKGYNACIFAYGQTGAGKTYTMQGQGINELDSEKFQKHRGLQPRVFEHLFSQLSEQQDTESLIQCNYFEIYNEQILDLLSDEPNKKCCIRESIQKGIYIENITDRLTTSSLQSLNILQEGQNNRHVGATQMNAESSRSHSVFSLLIETKKTVNGIVNVKQSKLHFVDLAGSERQAKTQAKDDRLKEANNINKSLTVLGLVINSLVEQSNGKNRHVPYRDSKLTHILKDSLGGNSKTYMIAAISQASTQFQETLSTLKFAQRAKMIQNKACVNEETSGSVQDLKQEIQRLKSEINEIQQQIPQQTPEQQNNQAVQQFIDNWNTKIFDIENYIRDQLRDFYQIYQNQNQEQQTEDGQEGDSIIKDKLQISSLKLNELTQLKDDIEEKLKNSGLKSINITNDILTPNDDISTNIGSSLPQSQNSSQQPQQQILSPNIIKTPVKQESGGILKKILKGIGKLSAEKSDNKVKQQQFNAQLHQDQLEELQIQLKDLNENNIQLQNKEQSILKENQFLIFQNNKLTLKIQEIENKQSNNQEIQYKQQQLSELLKQEQYKYSKLETQKQQIQQDLETQEELRIHWENMYYNEHKRYKFNYELVEDYQEQIEKLKQENEQLKDSNQSLKESQIKQKPTTSHKSYQQQSYLKSSNLSSSSSLSNKSQQQQQQQKPNLNSQQQQKPPLQSISQNKNNIKNNNNNLYKSNISSSSSNLKTSGIQQKNLSQSTLSNSSISTSKNSSQISLNNTKPHVANPKNFLKRKSSSILQPIQQQKKVKTNQENKP